MSTGYGMVGELRPGELEYLSGADDVMVESREHIAVACFTYGVKPYVLKRSLAHINADDCLRALAAEAREKHGQGVSHQPPAVKPVKKAS